MKKKNHIKELLIYIVEKAAISLTFAVPRSCCEGLGRALGSIFYTCSSMRRHIALNNLQIGFPDSTLKERKALAKQAFKSFGINYVEGIRIAKMTPQQLKSMVEIASEDMDLYHRMTTSTEGVVLLGCHSGSLPTLLGGLSVYGLKLHSITGTSNIYTDAWLKKKASLFGLDLIIRGHTKSYTELLSVLEQKHQAVNFFVDMDWSYSKAVFVDFFGKPAASPRGPARIFYRHEFLPVMISIERIKSFNYVIHLKEWEIDRTYTDKEEFIQANMQNFTRYFESLIRKDPTNWTWHHPRWKTRPENEN